jgi:cytochrome P450
MPFSLQTAVIKEALRLSHGVVSPLPRVVAEPTVIGGVVVPRGVSFLAMYPTLF